METPPNVAASKEFEVTGVSRSGRVRKKSSKLLDFQSPDEVEKKSKRTAKQAPRGARSRLPMNDASWKQRPTDGTMKPVEDNAAEHDEELDNSNANPAAELDNVAIASSVGSRMATDEDDDEDELDELVADIVEGVEAEAENATDTKVRQSLYMTEKLNKTKILKDGRVVTGKLQRKDKGKSRFTAYSLWAREHRKSSKFGSKQDLDFANAARRLSELWANVPNNEKNTWRRKAKRLAVKSNQQEESTPTVNANNGTAQNSSFLNRATTSRTKKLAAVKEKPAQDIKQKQIKSNASGLTPSKRSRQEISDKIVTNINNASTPRHHTKNNINNNNTHPSQTATNNNAQKQAHLKIPISGIEPIDAAAHLKLLGESLSIIGERLKEHEGQITVSGSLSVLLDSLLCSVGPLLCLTTRIPGLEKRKDLNENLIATLDNIAYVMPGL